MLALTHAERAMLAEPAARGLAMRVVVAAARALGAERLVPIAGAHIDVGAHQGEAGALFFERLVELGGRVEIPASFDAAPPGPIRAAPGADAQRGEIGLRLAKACAALGCAAPGWRPAPGEHVAWGDGAAAAFANSALGARAEHHGDFLDICAALTGRAPYAGLHRPENRVARIVVDAGLLSERLKRTDAFYPVFGAWLGEAVGTAVAAIVGLPPDLAEDRLEALGAAAAATGRMGLFHVVGVTPEAPTLDAVLAEDAAELRPAAAEIRELRDRLSSAADGGVDAVAIGGPRFSAAGFTMLERLLVGRRVRLPFYACADRDTLAALEASGAAARLRACGVALVADVDVAATRLLPAAGGVLMTDSGRLAHGASPGLGWRVAFGALADCVETAVAGRLRRDDAAWR